MVNSSREEVGRRHDDCNRTSKRGKRWAFPYPCRTPPWRILYAKRAHRDTLFPRTGRWRLAEVSPPRLRERPMALHVTNLCKDYPTRSGPLSVLRDVNLEL